MKYINYIYNFEERLQCGFSCIVSIVSLGRSWVILGNLGRSWAIFGNLGYLGQSWTILGNLGQFLAILGDLEKVDK